MSEDEIEAELNRRLAGAPVDADGNIVKGCEEFASWKDVFDHAKASFYIGSTSQKIRSEATQFLQHKQVHDRQNPKGQPWTPMITHPDGKRIKGIGKAETKWGFVFVPFLKNVSMYNCTQMEWALQHRYDFLLQKLYHRLWFESEKGREYQDVYGKCMVYVSLSFEVINAVASGHLIRGQPSLSCACDKRLKEGFYYEKGY